MRSDAAVPAGSDEFNRLHNSQFCDLSCYHTSFARIMLLILIIVNPQHFRSATLAPYAPAALSGERKELGSDRGAS